MLSQPASDDASPAPIEIVPYRPALTEAFWRLNVQWLERYFQLEEVDRVMLADPEHHVLAPGGELLFACRAGHAVGTCALLKAGEGVFELAKMCVDERCQGQGIGRRLLAAAIETFHRRGGRELFLESNSRLTTALRLYEAAGFVLQDGPRPGSHYRRADVYIIYRPTR